MHQYNLGYRFAPTPAKPEGWLEGFSGCALTNAEKARDNAIAKVKAKLDLLKHPFEEARVVRNISRVTPAELQQLKKDWKVSQQSHLT